MPGSTLDSATVAPPSAFSQPTAAPLPVLPALRRRRTWWALPFALSLLFVAAVAAWLQWTDRQEAEDRRRVLISDALSLESRLSGRIDDERAQADALARLLAEPGAAALAQQPALVAGLRRLWISATLLGADGRVLASLPELAPPPPRPLLRPQRSAGFDDVGLSAHLVAELAPPDAPDRGRLVVRYAPAALLRQALPWWLGRKYEVRLVDGWGQNIASTGEAGGAAGQAAAAGAVEADSYRLNLEPALPDTYLELSQRDRFVPWWRTGLLALMAVFIALVGAATAMLRRQVKAVSQAEAAWRTEAAWRRAMEDSLNVGLRARDTQGRLVYVNRAFCDQVGFGPDELLGRSPPMPYWPSDLLDERLSRLQRNLAGGAPREGYEARWQHRDGRAIEVMVFEARLVDALGRHIGWMGSTVDITERRRMEERERRQSEALAAQARLTTLGEVASALAHQLNQPLTAVAGYNAGVLRSLERAGYADAVVLQALRRLGEQANEAGRIVQRIRAFLTRRAPQREACDFEALARRATALLQRDLARQGVPLEWVVAPDLPAVQADPVLIEQVVINLLRNACDEMAAAATANPRIRIALRPAAGLTQGPDAAPPPGFVRLDLDDAGPGLRGRSIKQLCAPFYSTKADGMGMGLAICRSVVEAHVGAFDASDGALGGACFSFTLPVAEPPPPNTDSPAA